MRWPMALPGARLAEDGLIYLSTGRTVPPGAAG